jgi:hypothetical protein
MKQLRGAILVSVLMANGCGGDAPGPTDAQKLYGVVSLHQRALPLERFSSDVSVDFYTDDGLRPCSQERVEGCEVFICRPSSPGGGVPLPADAPHAGTITVKADLHSFVLTPDAQGHYQTQPLMEHLWTPGSTITIEATGGAVPAFSGSVVAPGDVTITAPVPLPNDQHLVLSRASDLEVTWTGDTAGEVAFGATPADTMRGGAYCRFPASAGRAVVKASVLAKLAAGEVLLGAALTSHQFLGGNGWEVTFAALGDALAEPGRPFVLGARLE